MKKIVATKTSSVLVNLKPHLSKTMIGKIKQNGGVFVDGESVRMSHIVECGGEIFLDLPQKRQGDFEVVPYFCDIEILFEDSDIIVLQKPSGMPTHTSRGNNSTTLENAYLGLLVSRGEDVRNFVFHPITRLDGETSGLVLVGKNPIAAAKLSADMQSGKIKKEYLALVNGDIFEDFQVDIYMGRVEEKKPQRWQRDDGKFSSTTFEVLERRCKSTLLKVLPKTGRTHQIRVHLAYSGYAIVGDKLYESGGLLRGEKPKSRLMLFMRRLEFEDMNGNIVVVKSNEKI